MDKLLIVVLLIVAGFGLHGYLRGFVRVVFSLVAVFLTIGLAAAMTPYTLQFLQTQTPLYEAVKEKCTEYMQEKIQEENNQNNEEEFGGQKEFTILGLEIPQELQNIFSGNAAEKLMEDTGIYEKAADFIAKQMIERLAWFLSFIIILILLSMLVHFLDLIAKLPVLKSINRIGGLAVGVFEGVVVVWILFIVVLLCQGSEFGRDMMSSIQGDFFLKWLYENNIIEQLFTQWLP